MPEFADRRRQLQRIAAIDLGSNSAHLVIAEIDRTGCFRVLDSEKIVLRLAEQLDENRCFTPNGIDAAVHAFRQMKEIASAYTSRIRAVATFATREARNHRVLIDRVKRETGIDIEVIDGKEEARLEFLGAQQGLPLHKKQCLLVDIGGGSTEIMVANGTSAAFHFAASVPLGAVTLTKKYLQTHPRRKHSRDRLDKAIEQIVARLPKHKELKYDWALASSGTAKALASVCANFFEHDDLSDPNGYVMTIEQIKALYLEFCRLGDPKLIRSQFSLDQRRAEILIAGTAILLALSKQFAVRQWMVSTYSLREGLVVDSFRRLGRNINANSQDLRRQHIIAFADQNNIDLKFATTISWFAASIYDQLEVYEDLDAGDPIETERELLAYASFLCEVGKEVSFQRYNKHSSYVLTNSDVMGFTQSEKQLMGHIVRFHRRSFATKNKAEFCPTLIRHLDRVNFLAGCLRLAIAANRSRQGRVIGVRVGDREGVLTFQLETKVKSELIAAEIHHFQLELQNFAKVMKCEMKLVLPQ